MRWLKEVEKALKETVLTSVSVEQVNPSQAVFKFNFENGESISTPAVSLPQGAQGIQGEQGEQGKQGEQGRAGEIEIGQVTTGAAGSPASVTNVGTAQNAILDFTIPQGIQGEKGNKGEKGNPGWGFESGNEFYLNRNISGVTMPSTGVFQVEGEMHVVQSSGGSKDFVSYMDIPIKGGGQIIVDVNSDNNGIEIRLDNALLSKINNALQLPSSTTTPDNYIVSVTTINSVVNGMQLFDAPRQVNLKLGTGLSISNGYLNATAGKPVYRHYLVITLDADAGVQGKIYLTIDSTVSAVFTSTSIFVNDWLKNQHSRELDYTYGADVVGDITVTSAAGVKTYPLVNIGVNDPLESGDYLIRARYISADNSIVPFNTSVSTTIFDTVVSL